MTTAIRGWHPQYPQYVNADTPNVAIPNGLLVSNGGAAATTINVSSLVNDAAQIWPRTVSNQNLSTVYTSTYALTTPAAMYNDVGKGNLGVDYRADNVGNNLVFTDRNVASPRPYV